MYGLVNKKILWRFIHKRIVTSIVIVCELVRLETEEILQDGGLKVTVHHLSLFRGASGGIYECTT